MRKVGLLLVVLVFLVAAGWSALWVWASREAGTQTDAWIAAEHRQGRDWTCPQRGVGGYPFALAVHCTTPTYAGAAMGQRVAGSLGGLVAAVSLGDPKTLRVTLSPPFAFKTSDGATAVDGTWQTLALDLASLPDIRSVALHGTGLSVDGTFGASGRNGGKAEVLDARFVLAPDQADPTLDFAVAVKGTAAPPLDDFLGGTAPIDITLGGKLDHADVTGARTPEEAMERWRLAGGRVDIANALVTRAGASASATGTLRLDGAHRPQGKLDAEFLGLDSILVRYGISPNLAAVGSIVTSLFGGGKPRAAPPPPGAIDLPIVFANGRLGIGPVTTDVQLPPLY